VETLLSLFELDQGTRESLEFRLNGAFLREHHGTRKEDDR
jgi:hypothetical protein